MENRDKEYYKRKLEIALEHMAEVLANGYQLDIAPSRSGVKIYSVGKKAIHVDRMSEYEEKVKVQYGR